jgi:cytochrome P450 family 6
MGAQYMVIQTRNSHQIHVTGFNEAVLTAQATMIFRVGNEKASTTMNFCLNDLALQPELQCKILAEIEAAKGKHGDKLTYETVLSLQLVVRAVSGTYTRCGYVATLTSSTNVI